MRRSSSLTAGLAAVAAALVLLTGGVAGADRPRLRPTPPPTDPVASVPPAVASAVPVASAAPLASPALPPVAGCYGLDRPTPVASPSPDADPAPVPSAASSLPPDPTPVPTKAPDTSETTRIKVKVAGVRMDLPADWISLQGDDLAALDDVPELTETLAALEASSLVLLGVDVLPGDGCVVGANLSLYDLGDALDPRLLALSVEAIALGLEELDEVAGDVKVTSVDLPVGEAQRLTFTFDATQDGAITTWWVRADVFTASGRTLLAAYAAPGETADDVKPTFTAIAKSIREL